MSRRRRRLLLTSFQDGLTIRNGLQLWLDAADTSTITSSGGSVSQWDDKSGNGNHATQGTGSAQPTTNATTQNGKNVIDFDGSNDTLGLDAALNSIPNGNNTAFIVAKQVADAGAHLLSLFNAYYLYYNGSGAIGFENNAASSSVTASATTTNWNIIQARRSGTSQFLGINSAESTGGTGASNAATDPYLGSFTGTSQFLNGSIAEVLIYNRSLTAAEISLINNYLSNKWGISLS